MSSLRIHPVILCGGSGTRLWPRSRKGRPKPFLPLVGLRTLLQETLHRCAPGELFAEPLIVAGQAHLDLIAAQAGADATVIIEPAAKNTAPAIALAAALLPDDALMLVCPSDHHIADPRAFTQAARDAAQLASEDWMVAFGIAAVRPETGYGYIRRGEALGPGYRIGEFVEKPDAPTARRFVAEGNYSWNGGIFAFRAGALIAELADHRPAMAEAVRLAIVGGRYEGREYRPAEEPFVKIASESIDYAMMENTRRAAMVPVEMGWSDIGSWEALRDAREGDSEGNRTVGRVELVECRNVLVDSDGPRVSMIGLENVIVVVDGDEVLVSSAAGAQKVGKLDGAVNQ